MRRRALIVLLLVLAGCGARDEVASCRGGDAIDFDCHERRYTQLARADGARAALRDLATERARNGYVRAACHQLTHRIGRAAGARHGMGAFADGRTMCSSGYYHGVVEAEIARVGPGRAETVCARLRERAHHSADHYNCAHGIGHGLMDAFASDVFRSLRGCDTLAETWEQRTCYGGVFMENLSAIGHPRRPPTALRPSQPLYPCTAVAQRYREACFDKQTTYALHVTDGDYAEVFALCARDAAAFRRACDRGVGGDIAVDSVKHVVGGRAQARTRRELCLLAPDRSAREDCVTGAVNVILRDLAGGAEQTQAFCAALRGSALAPACARARAAAYRDLPLQPGT